MGEVGVNFKTVKPILIVNRLYSFITENNITCSKYLFITTLPVINNTYI